ncbi:UNVERIFIED_CONTAM: hypothetical protein FKN15_022874 [Acipenser sinensis]
MNRTTIMSLITECRKVLLEDIETELRNGKEEGNNTVSRDKPYDNAYFYILFVMFFYSFLALAVFYGGHVRPKNEKSKKDPYEEFMQVESSGEKLDPACGAVRFDFEEESLP